MDQPSAAPLLPSDTLQYRDRVAANARSINMTLAAIDSARIARGPTIYYADCVRDDADYIDELLRDAFKEAKRVSAVLNAELDRMVDAGELP